jgi:hypothetical protein
MTDGGMKPRRAPPRVIKPRASQGFDERDPLGRMALFSEVEPDTAPTPRGLLVECSSCLSVTAVSLVGLARAALPISVHLPLLKGRYPSLMRCPACGRRTWVRLTYRA